MPPVRPAGSHGQKNAVGAACGLCRMDGLTHLAKFQMFMKYECVCKPKFVQLLISLMWCLFQCLLPFPWQGYRDRRSGSPDLN